MSILANLKGEKPTVKKTLPVSWWAAIFTSPTTREAGEPLQRPPPDQKLTFSFMKLSLATCTLNIAAMKIKATTMKMKATTTKIKAVITKIKAVTMKNKVVVKKNKVAVTRNRVAVTRNKVVVMKNQAPVMKIRAAGLKIKTTIPTLNLTSMRFLLATGNLVLGEMKLNATWMKSDLGGRSRERD